jgi:hypothetical protein
MAASALRPKVADVGFVKPRECAGGAFGLHHLAFLERRALLDRVERRCT